MRTEMNRGAVQLETHHVAAHRDGAAEAPNAARILAAAVGNCLSASLLFCLSRAGVKLEDIKSDVKVELTRNENRRLRIGHMEVTVRPKLSATGEKIDKCLETFEDFCVVTQSVREGLDVKVNVEPQ